MTSHWPAQRTLWNKSAQDFVRRVAMPNSQLMAFHARQRWLLDTLQKTEINASDVRCDHLAKTLTAPSALIFGSTVNDTAFSGSDTDYAIGFRKDPAVVAAAQNDDSTKDAHPISPAAATTSQFINVPRYFHSTTVLPALHTVLKDALPVGSTPPQRIFRARVPIIQLFLTQPLHFGGSILPTTRGEENKPSQDQQHKLIEFPPLLVGFDPEANKEIDLTASLTGCRNSLLLRRYFEQYPNLRILAMLLKHWSKRRAQILRKKRGWLTPYALAVMLIHHHAVKGEIDLLDEQENVEADVEALLAACPVPSSAKGPADCEGLRSPLLMPFADEEDAVLADEELPETKCLAAQLQSFFHYYANEFDFDTDVVDIRTHERMGSKDDWIERIEDHVAARAANNSSSSSSTSDVTPPEDGSEDGGSVAGAAKPTRQRSPRDDAVWKALGHEQLAIRDPYEYHSLGRTVDFFKAQELRDEFGKIAVAPVEPEKLMTLTI